MTTNNEIYYYTLVIGEEAWTLIASEQGLCRLLYPNDRLEDALPWLERHWPGRRLTTNRERFEEWGALRSLGRYFAGEPVDFRDIPLDLRGTAFQRSVWSALAEIPHGETRSYRELAEAIGNPGAVRAVGTANGRNPIPVVVPCHRVIGRDGTLTGYRGGLSMKQRLLELEGVRHVDAAGHERFRF